MKLNAKHQATAVLVAEDQLTDDEIAQKVRVHRSTLAKWKTEPEFVNKVAEISTAMMIAARTKGIARKEARLRILNEMHTKLLTVIDERAADPIFASVPGGTTGLLVRTAIVSFGKIVAYEYAVDVALLKELRAIEWQAAKELGQVVERRYLTSRDRRPRQHDRPVEAMSTEQIEALVSKLIGSVTTDEVPEFCSEGQR